MKRNRKGKALGEFKITINMNPYKGESTKNAIPKKNIKKFMKEFNWLSSCEFYIKRSRTQQSLKTLFDFKQKGNNFNYSDPILKNNYPNIFQLNDVNIMQNIPLRQLNISEISEENNDILLISKIETKRNSIPKNINENKLSNIENKSASCLKSEKEKSLEKNCKIERNIQNIELINNINNTSSIINNKSIDLKRTKRISSFDNSLENLNKSYLIRKDESFSKLLNFNPEIKTSNLINNPKSVQNSEIFKIELKSNSSKVSSVHSRHLDVSKINYSLIIFDNSLFRKIWDGLILSLLIYTIFITPLQICFYYTYFPFIIIEIIIEIVFIIEIVLNFCTSFTDEEENQVSDFGRITINYLTSWFFIDFFSSLPYEIIVSLFFKGINPIIFLNESYLITMNLLKWTKFLRVFKIFKKNRIGRFFDHLMLIEYYPYTRILKFMFIFFVLTHISSCIFISVGFSATDSQSWIIKNDLLNSDRFDIYIASLYYNMVTTYSVGYGDITPVNSFEKLIIIWIMFIGSMLYSYALSSLSTMFSETTNKKYSEYKRKLEILESINQEFDINSVLYNSMKKLIKVNYEKNEHDRYEFLNSLPSNMSKELSVLIYKDRIDNQEFLKNKSQEFILNTLPMLQYHKVYRDEILISFGDIIEEMYLVIKGYLSLTLGPDYEHLEIWQIKENNHFGDLLIQLNEQSCYEVKCTKNEAEILVLKKNDFLKLKSTYNDIILNILEESLKTLKKVEKKRRYCINLYEKYNNKKSVIKQIRLRNIKNVNKVFEEEKMKINTNILGNESSIKQKSISLNNKSKMENSIKINTNDKIVDLRRSISIKHKNNTYKEIKKDSVNLSKFFNKSNSLEKLSNNAIKRNNSESKGSFSDNKNKEYCFQTGQKRKIYNSFKVKSKFSDKIENTTKLKTYHNSLRNNETSNLIKFSSSKNKSSNTKNFRHNNSKVKYSNIINKNQSVLNSNLNSNENEESFNKYFKQIKNTVDLFDQNKITQRENKLKMKSIFYFNNEKLQLKVKNEENMKRLELERESIDDINFNSSSFESDIKLKAEIKQCNNFLTNLSIHRTVDVQISNQVTNVFKNLNIAKIENFSLTNDNDIKSLKYSNLKTVQHCSYKTLLIKECGQDICKNSTFPKKIKNFLKKKMNLNRIFTDIYNQNFTKFQILNKEKLFYENSLINIRLDNIISLIRDS